MTSDASAGLPLFRHTIATLAYRAAKALRNAPADFERFQAAPGTRTPGQILAHIGDLLDWALSLAEGAQRWHDSDPLPWDQEVTRFFAALGKLDTCLSNSNLPDTELQGMFQGPIADALTHVGQISLLRRLAGVPVRPENYHQAQISAGRVGPEQASPGKEF